MEPLVVLTSRPIVAMMTTLGYEMNYNVDQLIMLLVTTCHDCIIVNLINDES
jgi:hypothetical protein